MTQRFRLHGRPVGRKHQIRGGKARGKGEEQQEAKRESAWVHIRTLRVRAPCRKTLARADWSGLWRDSVA
jgi:hypothetical protein